MKAVILTMTSGEGHNQIAKTVAEKLRQMGVECEITDIFRHDGFEYRFNNWGYLFLCRYLPHCYDFVWKKLKFRKSSRRYHGTAQKEVEKIADTIEAKIGSADFDFFVCTHPYCAMLCDFWKRHGKFTNKKSFALLTDILPHPLWESAICCDYVLTPSEESFAQLRNKGFCDNQLVACGFPVAESFCVKDKTETRNKLGLKDTFTVLVTSGGFGIGQNQKVAKKLAKSSLQVLCVNGHNKKSFEKVKKLAAKNGNIHNYGFVNNMNELMNASNVVVAKGGAGTLFEALNCHLPIIVREKAIINERENADILQKAGAAIKLKRLSDICTIVEKLKNDSDTLLAMQKACESFSQGKSVAAVCEKMLRLL